MQNIYIVKIESKYFKRIVSYHIYINKIKKQDNYYLLYLDYDNYIKLDKFKKIYNIEFIGYKGLIKYKELLKKHYLFFIMVILGLSLIIFLSNIIFKIDIKTDDKEIEELVRRELESKGLSLYKFVRSYSDKEKIKKDILDNNKDRLEWLEITRVGASYIVEVEKRIINQSDTDMTPRNVVAAKNAIILSIEATKGSIVKKLNDYVKKGESVVSGEIVHKEEVVDRVRADATIYGETWYNVHVSYPIAYSKKSLTGKTKKRLSLTVFNKKYNLFDKTKFQDEEIEETKIFAHKFLPFKFSYEKVEEVIDEDNVYTVDEAYEEALKVARSKILAKLPKDSKILSQKKLKIIVNNSTIDVDIFFKVYENITAYSEIKEDIKEKEE